MDAIDRNIIRNLQLDGRLTNQDLAEKVNLSPSPCLRRVRNLEQQGVLSGYTALIDQEQYGLPINVFVNIRLEKQSDEVITMFEKGIQDMEEILECYLMTGSRDYLLRVVSQSLKTYEVFVREKLTTIPGIAGIESSFAFGKVKQASTLPPLVHFDG